MRIVSWNCGGGFRKKAASILALEPDLLVIQEITGPDAENVDAYASHWVGLPGQKGRKGRKGMAVFGFTNQPCVIADSRLTDLRWFLPVQWNGPFIMASWAHVVTPIRRYVRVMHEALGHYGPFLVAQPSIIIGDLNSNTVLDHKHRGKSHLTRLDALGMSSAYHRGSGGTHGQETTPTFFLCRHRNKAYHFDYVFGLDSLLEEDRLSIGAADDWIGSSDHLPLILDEPAPGTP